MNLSLTWYMATEKFLNPFESQSLHTKNGYNNNTYLMGLLKTNKVTHIKYLRSIEKKRHHNKHIIIY